MCMYLTSECSQKKLKLGLFSYAFCLGYCKNSGGKRKLEREKAIRSLGTSNLAFYSPGTF